MATDDTRPYSPLVIQLAAVSPSLAEWADMNLLTGSGEDEIKQRIREAMAIVEPERAVIGNAGDYVVTCRRAITPEEISQMLCVEFEGNPMASWIGSAKAERPPVAVPASTESDAVWYDDEAFIASPDFQFTIQYDDPENDGEGDCNGKKTINRADIVKGLELMATKSPGHWADLISESSADAVTYDVAMQYIVLGEVVYG